MFAFILNIIIISVVMWLFLKFMYPKPPKAFFPKEGDDTVGMRWQPIVVFYWTKNSLMNGFFVMLTISNLMPILIQKKIYQWLTIDSFWVNIKNGSFYATVFDAFDSKHRACLLIDFIYHGGDFGFFVIGLGDLSF